MLSLSIIKFCAEEVERQQDSPTMVYHMLVAWDQAMQWAKKSKHLSLEHIEQLGKLVCPAMNPHGFRTVNVQVGGHLCPAWNEVRERMFQLIQAIPHLEPEEAYLSFEEIHPFRDGNGRCGKILLAWLTGQLEDPSRMAIPNPWRIANP